MTRLSQSVATIMIVGLTGFIAACQQANNTGSSAGNNIDACKLVSADQASSILGTKITVRAIDTSAAGPDAASMCNYAGDSIGSGFMLIAAHIGYSDAAATVASQKKEESSHLPPGIPHPTFSDIKGLGDAAYLYETPGSFQLHVLAHGNAIVINRNTAASADAVEQARQIAQVALQRLK
ncbi:MAG TPA: hypothetical protein VNI58_06525 [Mariprofundaceae bacterium]|nr:hypothetical protein [Mariprofundaceae bacterium]